MGRNGQPDFGGYTAKLYQHWRRVTTPRREEHVMIVFVNNKQGEALMQCKPRKARLLLKEKKAKIVSYKPFTIQLLNGSSGYKQEVKIDVDLGTKHVGIAMTSQDMSLANGETDTSNGM